MTGEADFLFKENYNEMEFPEGEYGDGEAIILPGITKIEHDKFPEGLCARYSLKEIGVENQLPPWANLQQIRGLTDRIITWNGRDIVCLK